MFQIDWCCNQYCMYIWDFFFQYRVIGTGEYSLPQAIKCYIPLGLGLKRHGATAVWFSPLCVHNAKS